MTRVFVYGVVVIVVSIGLFLIGLFSGPPIPAKCRSHASKTCIPGKCETCAASPDKECCCLTTSHCRCNPTTCARMPE